MEGGHRKSGFRPDIQGIRAIAVVLVLMCHAELDFALGGYIGVDVFYVLSGFLITGLIVKEIEREGTLSLPGFYARRAKRLLPLAATVLVFVGVVSLIVYSTARQVDVGGDIIAAALFVLNWHFIAQGVDYFAVEEGLVSPIQHYWTLAVEEQFYVLWPVLLLAVSTVALRFRRRVKGSILAVVIPVAIASLVYGLFYTEADPQSSFFSTFARGWELAFGAILALIMPKVIRLPKVVATLMSVAAIAVMLGCAYFMSEIDPFPGWRALLPVLATMALLVAGASSNGGPVSWLLSTPPFQYVGRISYSLYLWHWPFVVFAIAIWGQLGPGWLVLATLASAVPAAITHKLIEEPFHHSKLLALRPNRALVLGAICIGAGVITGLALNTNRLEVKELSASEARGAAVIKNGIIPIQSKVEGIRPSPLVANDDKGQAYTDGCLVISSTVDSPSCVYGDPDSETSVVLFGDSHALQYAPAMETVADEKGWKLTVLSRGNCTPADVDIGDICNQWRENTVARIIEERPDLVVMATSTSGLLDMTTEDGQKTSNQASVPYHEKGLVKTINEIKESGAKIVMMGDQVQAPSLPHECVADHLDSLRECAFKNEAKPQRAFDRRAAKETGIEQIDPVPMLCNERICPAVIGNVLVYRDTYHMTATYATTLAPWLANELPNLE